MGIFLHFFPRAASPGLTSEVLLVWPQGIKTFSLKVGLGKFPNKSGLNQVVFQEAQSSPADLVWNQSCCFK